MDFVKVFKALGEETRLRILNLFLQSGKQICVCEITDALEMPQYHISRHLTVLRNIGLVTIVRQGSWIYYTTVSEPTNCVQDLFALVKKHFKNKYSADLERLDERLALRQNGFCVLGFSKFEKSREEK